MSHELPVAEGLFNTSQGNKFARTLRLLSGFQLPPSLKKLTQWTLLKSGRKDESIAQGKIKHDSACIFCELQRPDLNRIMQQNKTFYVRYDNFPASAGHVEIVPKRHVESFFELTARELKDAYALILSAQEHITDEFQPDGFTIGINEGRAAGRTVDHLHIHLIPRHFGDVEDPRGGIRRAVPNCDPDVWAQNSGGEDELRQLTEVQSGRR